MKSALFAEQAARLGTILGATFVLAACGPNHVAPFTPRERVYETGRYAQKDPNARPTNGSLYSDARGGLLEDTRAVRVGDFVVIHIEESADASGASTTNLSKDSSGSAGADALVGIIPAMKKAYPNMDPSKLFDYVSSSKFAGAGDTARKGTLTGNIAARVVRDMPNGDLFLEGTKVILINNEEYHMYVSGLVRPTDIAQDNTISSTRIADAQIEFTGRGDIADQQRKGWGARLLDTINPF